MHRQIPDSVRRGARAGAAPLGRLHGGAMPARALAPRGISCRAMRAQTGRGRAGRTLGGWSAGSLAAQDRGSRSRSLLDGGFDRRRTRCGPDVRDAEGCETGGAAREYASLARALRRRRLWHAVAGRMVRAVPCVRFARMERCARAEREALRARHEAGWDQRAQQHTRQQDDGQPRAPQDAQLPQNGSLRQPLYPEGSFQDRGVGR